MEPVTYIGCSGTSLAFAIRCDPIQTESVIVVVVGAKPVIILFHHGALVRNNGVALELLRLGPVEAAVAHAGRRGDGIIAVDSGRTAGTN